MFISVYAVLSVIKTVNKYLSTSDENPTHTNVTDKSCKIYAIDTHSDMQNENAFADCDKKPTKTDHKYAKTKQKKMLMKSIINYSISFNSSFLIVGALSESYLYGVRMVGNILAVLLGHIYSLVIIHPFMYNLDQEISTPYEYLEKRYNNKKYIRSLSSAVGMLFYFLFLSLYLWGCTAMLNTLIPEISLPLANALFGAYSLIGVCIGGFTQSTKTNVFQFVIFLFSLITAIKLTLVKSKHASLKQLWHLAEINHRTNFFDKSVDTSTRYTILNQLLSLPMPWCSKLGLFISNFMRYRSLESETKSKVLFISNIPLMILVNLLLLVAGGLVCFLYFFGCDPVKNKQILNKNQIGVYWLHLILSKNIPSLSGILFASIVYYSLIQHSLGMALCSKTIIDETLNPYVVDKLKIAEKHKQKIRKCFCILLGVLSLLIAQGFQYAKNTMLSLFFLFNNSINSPLLGLFLLSIFNPYANHVGATSAFVLNLAFNFWIGSGSLLFSRLKSQEMPTNTMLCENSLANRFSNFTHLNHMTHQHHSAFVNSTLNVDYYPKNQVLFYLYSIAPIWYCLFSVLFNLILGSVFSLIYSYIKTRSYDADSDFKEERKKYLFFYRFRKRV